jgi:hypothetical protein
MENGIVNSKKCNKCGQEKSLEMFSWGRKDKKRRGECRACVSEYTKAWVSNNRERKRNINKSWVKNNPEKCKAKQKRHWEKHKNEIREKDKLIKREFRAKFPEKNREIQNRHYQKRKQNPQKVLQRRIGNLVRDSLEIGKEGKSWKEFVDFSLADLILHLESQFTDGMSWEIFLTGEIHIDHYFPTNLFKFKSVLDYEFKLCWSLKNLRPVWKIDNLSKGDSLPGDGRSARELTEQERAEYLVKMTLVPEGYVYEEKSPESNLIETGDLPALEDFV